MNSILKKVLAAAGAAWFLCGSVAYAGNRPAGLLVTPQATSGTLTIVSATTNVTTLDNVVVVSISVTGVTDDGGGADVVCATIWDDGTAKVSQCTTVAVGATQTVTFTLAWNGSILTGAPGVGVDINDAASAAAPTVGALLDSLDPLLPAAFTPVTSSVPTLDPAGLLLLVLGLAVATAFSTRRRQG